MSDVDDIARDGWRRSLEEHLARKARLGEIRAQQQAARRAGKAQRHRARLAQNEDGRDHGDHPAV